MRYVRQAWENGNPATPLNGTRLSHLEEGVVRATAAPGQRVVVLGDSITLGGETHSGTADTISNSWAGWAGWVSGQRFHVVKNAGVSGDRSDQALARFDTDVAAFNPTLVTILLGTNDINQGVDLEDFYANMATILGATFAIGALPVLITIPPRSDPSTYGADIVAANIWLRQTAERVNVPLIDFFGTLVDPANGQFLSGYNQDGTHPNVDARIVLGQLVADELDPFLGPSLAPLPQYNGDPHNLVTNGLFLTDSNADGRADPWATTGAGSQTQTLDAAPVGNWQNWNVSSGSTTGLSRNITSGVAAGDRLRFVGRFKNDGQTLRVQASAIGATYQNRPVENVSTEVTDGIWDTEFTLPSGATGVTVSFTGGVGDHAVSQVGLYNLTALGLA